MSFVQRANRRLILKSRHVIGAHRYWRININTTAYATANPGQNYAAIAQISLTSSLINLANLLGFGIASASDDYYNATPASNACDNDVSTCWISTQNGVPGWWQYDFGAGNAFNITSIDMMSSLNPSQVMMGPQNWDLQYSDNSGTWITVQSFVSAPWVVGINQIFAVTNRFAP